MAHFDSIANRLVAFIEFLVASAKPNDEPGVTRAQASAAAGFRPRLCSQIPSRWKASSASELQDMSWVRLRAAMAWRPGGHLCFDRHLGLAAAEDRQNF
jgi:hypothetical protein